MPIVNGYTPLYRTNLVTSEYTKKSIGSDIEVNLLDYPNTEYGFMHECAWLYSGEAILLADKDAIKAIADAFKKVYDNLSELK